jgi:hypothetical protein
MQIIEKWPFLASAKEGNKGGSVFRGIVTFTSVLAGRGGFMELSLAGWRVSVG